MVDPVARLPRELVEDLEAVLRDEALTEQETREFAQLMASLMVVRAAEARLFEPKSGIMSYFMKTLEETAESIDRSLRRSERTTRSR